MDSIRVCYTNHRGERRMRHLCPLSLRWGHTEWHNEDQLLITCVDLETGNEREFSDAFRGDPGLSEVIALAVRASQDDHEKSMKALVEYWSNGT